MMRDSHTPIQVDIPGPKCLPPGLSLKNEIFGANIGYEVRAVSYFLMVYCKKKKKRIYCFSLWHCASTAFPLL